MSLREIFVIENDMNHSQILKNISAPQRGRQSNIDPTKCRNYCESRGDCFVVLTEGNEEERWPICTPCADKLHHELGRS
jgi:hypothetical protein